MNRMLEHLSIAVVVFSSGLSVAAPREEQARSRLSIVAASHHELDVRLSAPNPVLQGDADVTVTVTVTNVANHSVDVLRWQLPGDDHEGTLFEVTRDGEPVAYTGPLIKRAAPTAADYLRFEAGESISYEVELTSAYDLSRNGRYAIEYAARGGLHMQGAGLAKLQSAATLYLWLEGRGEAQSGPEKASSPVTAALPSGGLSKTLFAANCSASRRTTLGRAVTAATSYASSAASYLGGTPAATRRYVQWFGALSNARWNTARSHFDAVHSALTTRDITIDCGCRQRNVYAYVYANQPYKIYVCGAFWSAPLTGTDSKAGTLIHELTHFNVVAGTNDYAYGQSAAARLAITDPAAALDNADNHEYFAENTPALP